MIEIQFNGEAVNLDGDITVAELLAQNQMSEGRFIVVLNDALLVRADYDVTAIKAGDAIDIVSPITGG